MAETEVKWVHSHGRDNKNPDYDLGGNPSNFEIAVQPMNNLFDDITPEEAAEGRTDYRCFYIMNKRQDGTLTNVTVTLNTDNACGTIRFGTKKQNDKQTLAFMGKPTENGYVILETEFGAPFTCSVPSDGGDPPEADWAAFAGVLEAGYQLAAFSSGVTVTGPILLTEGAVYEVEFDGDLKNHKIDLTKIVQNSLVKEYRSEYRLAKPVFNVSNFEGKNIIQVTVPIDDYVPQTGIIHVPSPYEDFSDEYLHLAYISWAGDEFTLALPLYLGDNDGDAPFRALNENDELWVEYQDPQRRCVVNITKKQDGWPIGQLAAIIEKETDEPDWTDAGSSLDVGIVRPLEGFFLWVERDILPGQEGCKESFTIELTATVVAWPNT